jgi:hypothetical protein
MMSREEEAIELEYFIKKYIPKFWKEPIGMVSFVPSILDDDFIKLEAGEVPERFDKWYFKEAISKYFEKKK